MSLTLSALAVGAMKCVGAGVSLSVIQYFNTSRTLANHNRLAVEGREHSAQLQQLQHEFQAKLQERNFIETERIQREIASLQHKNAVALLDNNFTKQWDLYQNQVYIDKAWPLLLPPMHFLDQLKIRAKAGRLPLQIIVPSSQNDPFQLQITRIGTLLCSTYGSDVFFFDGAWKQGMGVQSAQMFDLQNNLGGCPTIVIKPEFVADKFIIKIAYWGMAALNAVEPRILTELSLRDIHLNALRQFADAKADFYGNDTAPDDYKQLISLRKQEKETYSSYIERHELDLDITQDELSVKAEEYCNDMYRASYNSLARQFEADILEIRNHYFEGFIGVAAIVMTDMHRMLEYHAMPMGVSLASSFKCINESTWLTLMTNTYMDILGHMSHDVFFELPLYYALVASSFKDVSGGEESAKRFADEGWKRLQKLYSQEKHIEVETHIEAFHILSKIESCPFFSSKIMIMNIQELNDSVESLNESIESTNHKMEKSFKTLSSLCTDQKKDYNLDEARKILADALKKTLDSLQQVECLELKCPELDKHVSVLNTVIENCCYARFSVAMIGEYQSGKTTTANALCGGCYVAPMGSGVKTSAMPIIFSYAENESVTVHWKLANEFSFVFETLAPCVNGFDWSNFDIDNRLQREVLLEELEAKRSDPTVTSRYRQFFVLGCMILKWYGSQDLEAYKKKTLKLADVQVLGRFSEDLTTRWVRDGISAFTLEESLFPLISMIKCTICSDLLSSMRCDLIDCPGLFANDYDTAVTHEVMDRANAILYLLPYHKAISEEGVGGNLIRLKDDYKGLVNKKLFIVNNLQFSNPNTEAIERANKDKVNEMFGAEMSFVSYDARLAFIAQLYLSWRNNAISPETEQRFIDDVQQGVRLRFGRFRNHNSSAISDLESAVQYALRPYDLPNPTDPLEVYDNSEMGYLLEALNRFVARNEAYSILVTKGIDKLKNNLKEWKLHLQLTHIEPYTSGLSTLEALWESRKIKASEYSEAASITVKNKIMPLKDLLTKYLHSDVFTQTFYDILYKRLAGEIYDIRWVIIKGMCTPKAAEEARISITNVSNRVLTALLEERLVYINKSCRDLNGSVRSIIKPAIENLNTSLTSTWAAMFEEDPSFSDKRELYYALPSGLNHVSTLETNIGTDSVIDNGIINPASQVGTDVLAVSLALIAGTVASVIGALVAAIILDIVIAGGFVSLSAFTIKLALFMAAGYSFKEAFQKTKEAIGRKNRESFIKKVVDKLKMNDELTNQLSKVTLDSVDALVEGLLDKYCSNVTLNSALLYQHAEEALEGARNGNSANLYNRAIGLLNLINNILKSYNNCLEKLTQLPPRQ